MKKPPFALPLTLLFLAASARYAVKLDAAQGIARPQNASDFRPAEAGDPGDRFSPGRAQASGSDSADKTPVKRMELLVLGPRGSDNPAGSASIRMGFLIELEPGWHIYWSNPGDAGLAPGVRWTLPPGFTAGPLQHPLPRKSVEEGIVSFVHDGPVLLACDITPPPSARPSDPWEAAAVLEWMACRESCIVGETAAQAVYPPEAAAREKGRALLEQFAPWFPRPLSAAGISAEAARAELMGAEWRVEIVLAGPRAAEADDFFPFPGEDFVFALSGISCRDGRITVPLAPSRGPGAAPPQSIHGLVIIDGAGYEAAIPIASRPRSTPLGTHSVFSWR